MRLNKAQAEAVVNLQVSPSYQALLEAMNAYRQELLEMTMYGQEDSVQTYRGMARGVTEVMRALGGARDILVKSRGR